MRYRSLGFLAAAVVAAFLASARPAAAQVSVGGTFAGRQGAVSSRFGDRYYSRAGYGYRGYGGGYRRDRAYSPYSGYRSYAYGSPYRNPGYPGYSYGNGYGPRFGFNRFVTPYPGRRGYFGRRPRIHPY
jgi:hypothetical protein